jgi:hypothetical protein
VLRALLRASLTSTVLVVLYYKLPLTGALDASTIALLLAGLVLFAAVISWQVRAILRSRYPALRAIEALAAAIPLFLLVFAAAYVKLADAQAHAFTEPLNRTDALYFTITAFSTVGFGDIAPVATAARVTVPGSPSWSRCWATWWWSGWSCGSCSARSRRAGNGGPSTRPGPPNHPIGGMPGRHRPPTLPTRTDQEPDPGGQRR